MIANGDVSGSRARTALARRAAQPESVVQAGFAVAAGGAQAVTPAVAAALEAEDAAAAAEAGSPQTIPKYPITPAATTTINGLVLVNTKIAVHRPVSV
jgi:hypothetical protein